MKSIDKSSEILRKARVKDVAAAAGVSVATVSRSFNLPDTVSDEVRRHVLAVASRLGYSPNPSAKALRLQRTHIVGAVFPSTEYGIYAQMLGSFQHAMSQAGYLTVLLTVGFDNQIIYDPVRELLDRGVEGLMIVGRIEDERLERFLLERQIPVVCTYSDLPDCPFASIGVDNYGAVASMVRYLHRMGHREFALFSSSTLGNDRQRARQQGFIDTLEALEPEAQIRIFEDPDGYSLDFARSSLHVLMRRHPEVTALMCTSDLHAVAVVSEAARMGLSVPDRLSITGFDNQNIGYLVQPPLTTVSVPATQMGSQAAQMLLKLREGELPGRYLRLDAPMVVRGSTAPAPAFGGPG